MTFAPGSIRDAVARYLETISGDASLAEISAAVAARLGTVPASSVRSYLNLNAPGTFTRMGRGRYRLTACQRASPASELPEAKLPNLDLPKLDLPEPVFSAGQSSLYHMDCFEWLARCEPASVHAVVTDPPYGLVEYSPHEQAKLRAGKGGVWRVPPSFDGNTRSPLPRFTTLDADDLMRLHASFARLGALLARAVVPGANVLVASNPLLSHIVASAMSEGGLEVRGTLVRLTMTMRGGDRPKNAHMEFSGVSVMPRSMWEPWVVLRRPLDGRVQDNLRRWGTGGFRRLSAERPFGDVIRSHPASAAERAMAPHPSLKPQGFLRQVVRASLPLGTGVILDPFAGSGSTLAAANAVGQSSIGIERDERFAGLAKTAIPALSAIQLAEPASRQLGNARPVQRRRAGAKLASGVFPEIPNLDLG